MGRGTARPRYIARTVAQNTNPQALPRRTARGRPARAGRCRSFCRRHWPPQVNRRHGDAGEIGRRPELGLGGRQVDPQVWTQPAFHLVGEQPANVVHVHVGEHHIGHGRKIDTGGLQSQGQPPAPRQVRKLHPHPGVDEYGPAAATLLSADKPLSTAYSKAAALLDYLSTHETYLRRFPVRDGPHPRLSIQ